MQADVFIVVLRSGQLSIISGCFAHIINDIMFDPSDGALTVRSCSISSYDVLTTIPSGGYFDASTNVHGLENLHPHPFKARCHSNCPCSAGLLRLALFIYYHSLKPSLTCIAFHLSVGGIWTTVQTTLTPHFSDIPHIRAPPTLWLLTSAITDVSITVALTYSLVRLSHSSLILIRHSRHLHSRPRRPVSRIWTVISPRSSAVGQSSFVVIQSNRSIQ
jgi:hypothetical protein